MDSEARAFGIPPATSDFLAGAVAALGDRSRAAAARTLLARYVPDGPGAANPIDHWDNNSFTTGGPYTITLTGTSPDPCGPGPCCRADFNGDGDIGTDQDIEDFFACLAGNCCATCGTADFNGDGDVATDADIEAFFRVLAGGNC